MRTPDFDRTGGLRWPGGQRIQIWIKDERIVSAIETLDRDGWCWSEGWAAGPGHAWRVRSRTTETTVVECTRCGEVCDTLETLRLRFEPDGHAALRERVDCPA